MTSAVTLAAAGRITPENGILKQLPDDELQRLSPHLSRVQLVSGQVLYERGALIEHAYFIESGMISVVSGTLLDQLGVEVGIVGHEGLAGCWGMFDDTAVSFCRALVQIAGSALRIRTASLHAVATELPALRQLGFRFLQAAMAQVAQSTACNAIHSLQKRAARWLLVAQDRADGDGFPLTQEFLSNMLGVRRPGVTEAAGLLQDAGLISYSRGRVRIIDRPGLERASCDCYRLVRNEYDRLLAPSVYRAEAAVGTGAPRARLLDDAPRPAPPVYEPGGR